MPKFRKKPVIIDAWLFDGSWETAEPLCTQADLVVWNENGWLTIKTLEGDMHASAGDWIIKGVKGEFSPCKPDIFERTYEAA